MLEVPANCPAPNYSHIVHSSEGVTSLAPQLNFLTDLVLELKVELAKIKAEVKEIKNQLAITHLSLVNEIRHSNKSDLGISSPFQHKYPFQNPKNQKSISSTRAKHPKRSRKITRKIIREKIRKRWIISSII